ncbi:MAG: alpha/beta hydrolase [Allomuricauda sp.]
MLKNYIMFIFCSLLISNVGLGQDRIISLWPNGVPNQRKSQEAESQNKDDILWIENVQNPTLEVFLPAKRNSTGKAIVVCPGGGYQGLAYDWEGTDIARWLNSKGIAAFVLKYRLTGSKSIIERSEAPLQDAQRAIRIVRQHSKKWNINTNQIGIIGFSAGGHLASSLATQYDSNPLFEYDEMDAISARPDFAILVYPVVTMKTPHTHMGSRNNLLGNNPDKLIINRFSNELQVTENTPTTFIIHATDDEAVPVENSILFYKSLKEKNVSAEMHIYPQGGHGFSLALDKGYLQTWTDRLFDWLNSLK